MSTLFQITYWVSTETVGERMQRHLMSVEGTPEGNESLGAMVALLTSHPTVGAVVRVERLLPPTPDNTIPPLSLEAAEEWARQAPPVSGDCVRAVLGEQIPAEDVPAFSVNRLGLVTVL